MERFDVAGDERLAAMVDAVERGQEVLLTRDGAVMAEVVQRGTVAEGKARPPFDFDAFRALRDQIPEDYRVKDAAALIRAMRDARDV